MGVLLTVVLHFRTVKIVDRSDRQSKKPEYITYPVSIPFHSSPHPICVNTMLLLQSQKPS